jgi:hypothetical protein
MHVSDKVYNAQVQFDLCFATNGMTFPMGWRA